MTAPFVTGAIALYAAAYPDASAPQIREALLATAAPTPSLSGMVATGGRLDVSAMLAYAPRSRESFQLRASQTLTPPAQPSLLDAPAPDSPTLKAVRPRTREPLRASR
ncbi:MAG: hypothetical protein KatS3mg108_3666 [Isosphaeraceae bacterium]|jgi:hypothetical protein|nr:MAG: hypothetical protein KatS3mg108_3666 [Isosphaeraceae bacterium]